MPPDSGRLSGDVSAGTFRTWARPMGDGKPGKGSHSRVYYGTAFTTIKDLKKEIGSGLLRKMLADLRLTKDELK